MGEAAAADAPDPRERVLQVSDLHGLMNSALQRAGLHR